MQTIALFDLSTDPTARPMQRRAPLPLGELPISSVPAAYYGEHLYSPKADTAALVDHRPGNRFPPLPTSPSGPKAWNDWWRTEASVPTPDYLGLEPGDVVTVVGSGTATVMSTCRFGALVRYALPPSPWADRTHGEMYVTARNQFGHWYR
ncbi:hypothetical protein [Streptomyces longispororuber]|uniref:hypothetical protein n=1 Tax=Streptomyces longispororuber TaxID=68230 RepID=UPI0037017CC0